MQGAWLLDMVRVHTILGVVFEFDPIYCAGGVGDLNPTHQCAKVLSFTFFSSHGKKKRVNSDSDNGPLPCGCRYRLSDVSQSPALHSGNWVYRFRDRFSGRFLVCLKVQHFILTAGCLCRATESAGTTTGTVVFVLLPVQYLVPAPGTGISVCVFMSCVPVPVLVRGAATTVLGQAKGSLVSKNCHRNIPVP